jgi:hypothetical protein
VAACDVGDLDSIPGEGKLTAYLLTVLKGQCHEIFASGSFMNQFPPSPKLYRKGRFKFFRKDIRSSRFATGVNNTGGKWKKSSVKKFFLISFGYL